MARVGGACGDDPMDVLRRLNPGEVGPHARWIPNVRGTLHVPFNAGLYSSRHRLNLFAQASMETASVSDVLESARGAI